jgi:hypothetical protein
MEPEILHGLIVSLVGTCNPLGIQHRQDPYVGIDVIGALKAMRAVLAKNTKGWTLLRASHNGNAKRRCWQY